MPKHSSTNPPAGPRPQHLAPEGVEAAAPKGTDDAVEEPGSTKRPVGTHGVNRASAATHMAEGSTEAQAPAHQAAGPAGPTFEGIVAQPDTPTPERRRRLRATIATALVVAGMLICIAVALHTTTATGDFSAGSAPTVVEPAPTAEELLAASPFSRKLFTEADHRELEHEAGYENLLDDEILTDTQAFAGLAVAIGDIEDIGYDIGIVLVDLETGGTFAYNADEDFYSASSIKGPYVTCLYETLVETGKASLSELSGYAWPIIVDSDNITYGNLHRRFGGDQFETWLVDIDYDMGEYESYDEISEHFYLHINAWQLAALWERSYAYLASGTEAAAQLTECYEARAFSALASALGEKYVTWGKAGWYPDNDGYAWPATVDAGVVLAKHPYVVAVLTNIPDNMARLEPVFAALDQLHEGLYLLGTDYRIEPASSAHEADAPEPIERESV